MTSSTSVTEEVHVQFNCMQYPGVFVNLANVIKMEIIQMIVIYKLILFRSFLSQSFLEFTSAIIPRWKSCSCNSNN